MNLFEGALPRENSCADGHAGTAPVDSLAPSGYGLHSTTGNVWEGCADWFDPGYYAVSAADILPGPAGTHCVMRGGSYLCHASF